MSASQAASSSSNALASLRSSVSNPSVTSRRLKREAREPRPAYPGRGKAAPCSSPRAIWVYLARNALILSAPCPICAIPLRWPFGPVNVTLSTDVPAAAIFWIVSSTIGS